MFRGRWWIVFGSVLGLTVGNVTVLQFSTSVLMKPTMAELGVAYDVAGSYRPALMGFVAVLAYAAWLVLQLPRRYPYPVQSPAQARTAEDPLPYESRITRSLGNS
jgi:hypothetical protein